MTKGRPSKWLGVSKMMRLPEAHENRLQDLAHQLEAGEEFVAESHLQDAMRVVLQKLRPQDRRRARNLFKRLEAELNWHTSPAERTTTPD